MAALFAGALPAVAGATDYCVDISCGGKDAQSLEDAIGLADDDGEPDRIFLGAEKYTAPTPNGYNYSAADTVEIIGQGIGQTILTGPPGAFSVLNLFGGPDSSVQDLTIRLPESVANGARGLSTQNTARRIEVVEDPTQPNQRTGVSFEDEGTLEDSTVTLSDAPDTTGVYSDAPGITVRRSAVRAWIAVRAWRGATVERSRLTGGDSGVVADSNITTVTGSLIRLTQAPGVGLAARSAIGIHSVLNADGVTIVGPGLPNTWGAGVSTEPALAESVDLKLTNAIIRGVEHPLAADASDSGGQARIAVSYSDYDPSGNRTFSSHAGITEANVSNVGDARFVDAAGGDYHLLPTSALVDAGDPASAQGLDLDGHPLIADGNGDGGSRRDLGAFELQPAATAGDPASGGQAPDRQAPLVSGFRAVPSLFAVRAAGMPSAARLPRGTRFRYTLSESAHVAIAIRRALPGRRAGGRCVRPTARLRRARRCTRYRTVATLRGSGTTGANTTRFSGRVRNRSLRPGRYAAVIRATDAAGNRSARRATRFRISLGGSSSA